MKLWAKLNPINSLFGRIFLWFWLATIVIVLSAVWLARQDSQSYSIRPLPESDQKRLTSIAKRVEIIAQRRPQSNLSLLLGRAGHRNKMALMLVNPRSREVIYGFPRALGPQKDILWELIESQQAFRMASSAGIFEGPINVVVDGNQYKLFAGKPEPRGPFSRFQRKHPWVLISVAVLISAGLCALLAWSFARPIRELQGNAKKMASGILSARVSKASKRGDELGQLGKDFNQMAEQIEKLVGGQKRLVADISHELRSPLARLQLAIGIAQQNPKLIEDAQLQRIEKEAQQIDILIGQVLQLSRLEANMPQEELQRCNLSALVEELINDAGYEAKGSHKTLQCAKIPDIELDCYPQLFISALQNILRNGIKYAHQQVAIDFKRDDKQLQIQISDDGPGVPESALGDIFTPFYRLSSARSRDSGGTGLGLAIAHQAVVQHRGQIEAQNLPAAGLQISISIPLHLNPALS